jgi:hypothetical protein
MKRDGIFGGIVRPVGRLPKERSQWDLEEFWPEIYADPSTQMQGQIKTIRKDIRPPGNSLPLRTR